jgi:hypothetical protein
MMPSNTDPNRTARLTGKDQGQPVARIWQGCIQCRRDAQDEPEHKGRGAGQVDPKHPDQQRRVIQVKHGDESKQKQDAAQEKIDPRDVQKHKTEQEDHDGVEADHRLGF